MSGFPILDLVIGLIFLYFLLSVAASSMVEVAMGTFKLRGRILQAWLFNIFDKQMMQPDGSTLKLGRAIMDHCMTTGLSKPGSSTAYMDSNNFVSALLEKVTFKPHKPDEMWKSLDDIMNSLQEAKALDGTPLLSTDLRRSILAMAQEAKMAAEAGGASTSPVDIFRTKLSTWFDTSMDRITGRLKTKYVRPLTFVSAVIIVVGMNADTIALSKFLYHNPEVSNKMANTAMSAIQDTAFQKKLENPDTLANYISTLNTSLPLGWTEKPGAATVVTKITMSKVAGWFMTILAIMLGAPFWFDLLNKISNIRANGSKPVSVTDTGRKASTAGKIINTT